MGDLRNKFRKIEETEAHQERLRRLFPTEPPPPAIRCACGYTHFQTQLWGIQRDDIWRTTTYHCGDCIPEEYRDLIG